MRRWGCRIRWGWRGRGGRLQGLCQRLGTMLIARLILSDREVQADCAHSPDPTGPSLITAEQSCTLMTMVATRGPGSTQALRTPVAATLH
jgi:hypothetical protein